MIVRHTWEELKNRPLSEQDVELLKKAAASEPVPDEDSPEYSYEDMIRLMKVAKEKRAEQNKQTVTLRISPDALHKARALGKGYTSVLGRVIEKALNDPNYLKDCL